MKSGSVAIIGRPNVGKSTLLNTLLQEKIAIVSGKPQTTRTRILGVMHRPDAQIALLDTPGLHEPRYRLNRRMVKTALDTMKDADLLYVMVEATSQPGPGDRLVVEQVRKAIELGGEPAFLLINKVDLVKKSRVLPLIESYCTMLDWTEVVPISAKTGLNLDRLLELTVKLLHEGEALFGEDVVTDQSMRTMAAEFIREQILQRTREELPYSVAVEIDQFIEEGNLARIAASVLVERESQKGIIVGKHGARLKEVATCARLEMEKLFGMKVFLEVWVRVRVDWRQNEQILAKLGY